MLKQRTRLTIAAAAAVVSSLLMLIQAASAAEAILFDGDNCTGKFRMIDRSISNFNHMEFDNKVNSLMVITGSFQFYRDPNYEEDNGPSFLLGPSGYQDTCWSLQDASGGNFPTNKMSSAKLIADTPGPQPKGIVMLFEDTNFRGSFRILTRAVSDFKDISFDNEVESLRVMDLGIGVACWRFYFEPDYFSSHAKPELTLVPGALLPDISEIPGAPPNYFPRNVMSSAQICQY